MGEENKYLFGQYASGRKIEGYTSQNSEAATSIPSQLVKSTRAAQVTDELPTRELQSYQTEGFLTFALNHSIHVANQYDVDQNGEIISKGKTRNYDFTQSILLQENQNPGWEDDRVSSLLEMLTEDKYFWTPYDYQIQGEKDKLADLEVSREDLHHAWYKLTQHEQAQAAFSEENLAAFLARYWEVCFERHAKGETENPLIVVATSPERNSEKCGRTVIEDGIRFFHDQVLPCLPPALQKIISVSFGCVGIQQRAQKGTACMFCYPEVETLNLPVVYAPYDDKVFDDTLDPIMIQIGEDLRTGKMQDAFTKLCSLPGGQECAQDFTLYYEETKLNMLIDDYASATDIEKRNELEENCLDSLTAIREVLKKNGLSSDEITWLLYRIEHKWRKACAKATAEKSERMIRSWAADYITLNNRTAKLTEEEIKELKEQFEKFHSFQGTYGFLPRVTRLINDKKMYTGRNGEPAADLLVTLASYDDTRLSELIRKRREAKKEESEGIDIQCLEDLETLRKHLNDYGFSQEETTLILLQYELKFREVCQSTSSDMIQIWTRDYLDRGSRSVLLPDPEKQQLEKAYQGSAILKGKYNIVSDTIVRIEKGERLQGDDSTTAEDLISRLYPRERLITEAMARQQNSGNPEEEARSEAETHKQIQETQTILQNYGFTGNEISEILYEAVFSWVAECGKRPVFHQEDTIKHIVDIYIRSGNGEVIQDTEKSLCNECIKVLAVDRDEWKITHSLLNTCENESHLPENKINELVQAIRGLVSSYAKKARIINTDPLNEINSEINHRDEIAKKLQKEPFFLTASQIIPLLAPMEILIPRWAVNDGHYYDELYRFLLESATRKELTDTIGGQLSPEDQSLVDELWKAYSDALNFDYSDPDTANNPLKVIVESGISNDKLDNYEPNVCENMQNHPEVEFSTEQLIQRMITQAERDREKLADNYHQLLLRQNNGKETEVLLKFIRASYRNNVQNSFQNKVWLRQEARKLMDLAMDADELLNEEQLSEIAEWNDKNLPQADQLTGLIVDQFSRMLTDKLRDDESVVQLIERFGKSRILRDSGKEQFTGELIRRMNSFELEQIAQSGSLLDAIRAYQKIDSSINSKIAEILVSCVETRTRSVGVTTGDIPLIIQASTIYEVQDEAVKKSISIVLENCEGAVFDPESLNALREYLKNHIAQTQQQDQIILSLQKWLLQPKDVYIHTQKKMADFISLMNDYVRQGDRMEAIHKMLQDVLPCLPEDEMPDPAFLEVLMPYASDNRGSVIREKLIEWYDRISIEESMYPQMDALIQNAKIRTENREAFQKYPKWTRYFLDTQTGKLISMIQEQPLSEVIGYAEQGDKTVREFNRLFGETKVQEEGLEFAQKQSEKLEEALLKAIEEEARTQSNAPVKALALVNKSLNYVDERNQFAVCVKDTVLKYFNSITQNNEQFKAALRDRDAISALENAFRQNQIEVANERAELKKQAVFLASDVVGFYEKCRKQSAVDENDMKVILEKIENQREAYSLVDDVCLHEGCQSLSEEKTLLRDLPGIVSHFERIDKEEWIFDWMNYLNSTHERANGIKWESASILTDDDNTYGTLASVLQWMNDSHLTKTQHSFEKFLSSSSIGRTAKASMKKVLKHLDKQTENPMIKWLESNQKV